MFDYSEVRCLSPSISFIFSRLGASFESSGGGCPQVELFISKSSTLGLVLADLYPLLRQSLDWFQSLQEMSVELGVGSEVRSSELEMGLSSSNNPMEVEADTVVSIPLSSKPSSSKMESWAFHASKEECSLDGETLFRFRDRFQFPNETRIRLPCLGEKACALFLARCVSTRLHS